MSVVFNIPFLMSLFLIKELWYIETNCKLLIKKITGFVTSYRKHEEDFLNSESDFI